MESRDIRKSFAHTKHRVREPRNADNSLLSGPVEPIKMLFISTSSGWERVSAESNGRIDYSSKSPRPSYGVDSPNAMLKYACRNRAQERFQQGCNEKQAFPWGDLTRRDVPVSTFGCRSTRVEAPPPLVGSPDMPMPGIPVAEVRESVMISRPPSGPSNVEKKPSVTNLHGSRPNWTRICEEASCSRKHGGGSRHRDFAAGFKHDCNTRPVERTASSELHSASSVFHTVSKALESQKRNKHNFDSSIPKKHLNLDNYFSASAATPDYSSVPLRNRPDIQSERTNTLLNDMNNTVFNSLSSIDEMLKAPDICEYRNFSLNSSSSMVRVAQNAQRDLDQSVIKFEELIDVVSSTMTELQNISTSDSYDSCMDNVPNRNNYRRYRQVQEITSNVNCYVTTDPGLNPVSVSAFTTTTVTNLGESRRSDHSVGDSFLNDYPKKSNDFSTQIDGCYKFSADESGDRNTRTHACIEYSSLKNHGDKDFHYQEGKQENIYEKEEVELSKTLNLASYNKNQEVNANENDKMHASDSFSKEIFEKKESKIYVTNTLGNDSAKELSSDANKTQEQGHSSSDFTGVNKSPENVNYVTEGLDTNASTKSENITQKQESTKPAKQKDSVDNSAGVVEKSANRRLNTRITKLNDQKFYKSTTPVEIAHSIISDYSKSIGASVKGPTCQQQIECSSEKNELKTNEVVKFDSLENNNDLSQNVKSVKANTTKSSETSDVSDSAPNSPRKPDLETRACATDTSDEKPQHILHSDHNCVIQIRTTPEKEAEKHSELSCKITAEDALTKTDNLTEQGDSGEIKSEISKKENTNEETKSEMDKSKEYPGTHILQSLDRKVLDVMELVKNQLEKERTRQPSLPDNTIVRKKTQKNTVVRNESVRFAKDERGSSRHVLLNKHLDSRSHKCLHRTHSSRREDDLEGILRSRRKDRQGEIPNEQRISDIPGYSNEDRQSSTSLRQVAALSVISEDSDVSKKPETDQRTVLDALVDNVTGMIKFKKLQLCLIDTLKNSTAESETQRCSTRVTRPISPINLRLQRKSALPKSLTELDKETVSSVGVFPTSARCTLMRQDNRVECIAPDLKKRGEELKKPSKPKETTKEMNLKANKIGISNNLITAAKRDNIKEVIKNQPRDRKCNKCANTNAKKENLEPCDLKNTEITIVDDKTESGSDRISPVGSSANVYDIKINISNRVTSNTNLDVESISETINTGQKVTSNSSDENYEPIVNRSESLNERSEDQLTNREKRDKAEQQNITECTSKIRSNKNGPSKTESNELNDSHPRKENLLQTETVHLIPHQIKDDVKDNTLRAVENVKILGSNNDTSLAKSQSGNTHLYTGDKSQSKNNKSLSDSFVKDRRTYLKRNTRITSPTSPTNTHSRMGDGDLYHTTNKISDNFLKVKELRRKKLKSFEKPKDIFDKYAKLNSRYTKPYHLEPSDGKTKSSPVSGTSSPGVQKQNKVTANKPTTSSDRYESSPCHKVLSESHDYKSNKESPKLFEGYGCGSYVKVDAQLCPSVQTVTPDSGGISKVHIKTNTSKRPSCMNKNLHKSDIYEGTNRKTKLFSGYGAALFIKPDGHVNEINLGSSICSKRNCNCPKHYCCESSGSCFQVEISQAASSSGRDAIVNINENANKITHHKKESIKDIVPPKYSAVKLFFEKPSRTLEEKIISQVCYENGLFDGTKSNIRPFDFILNGIKFSDTRKIVSHKSSVMNNINPFYDTDGLCLFSPEENNIFIDRNKLMPTICRRGSSAQGRGVSFFKEMPVIEKRLSTLIEILESLIKDDRHENICCKSSSDNHEETETRETEEDISINDENVVCTKQFDDENTNESKLEYVDKDEVSTMISETSRDYLRSETGIIVPQTGPMKNHSIQYETDVSQTFCTIGKSLVSEEVFSTDGSKKYYESKNGEITRNEISNVAKRKDLLTEEGIIAKKSSQSHRKGSIEPNIEIVLDASKSDTTNENVIHPDIIRVDVNMPVLKDRTYELETLKAYEDDISTECTDNSNHNEFLNRSRCSSCSTLFSSCDSLTTNDYVEIFRGYIDGDNSTEKEVDLYDDSTESSNITQNNSFTKQKLEEWKMNVLRNRPTSHSSDISYNLTVGRGSSNSTAHYPSESEVSTYPRRISTQSSNMSSLKRLCRTERNENKSISNDGRPDITEYKWYSVAELSQSRPKDTENEAANYWTFEDYLRLDESSTPGCSNRVGINMETFSEVTSSNLDREKLSSLSSIISRCVEETLNKTLRDITATFDFETYGHILSQKLQSYNESENSSCQELTVNENQTCETTDSDSNICNCDGKMMRTTRINVNPFSEDSNEYPSSYTNSHREVISSGYNENLNYSSSNSEEDASKDNCTSSAFESSQYGMFHSNSLYRGVRNSATTWQRESLKSAEEEDNSQASSQDQTSLSSEGSETDESSTSDECSEYVQEEKPVAVLDLTSPETVTRVLDAMAHSEERQPIDDELDGDMGVFEFHDLSEFVLDESVIHASSDYLLPYPIEDSENTRPEDCFSLSRMAEQYSAAVLTRRRTSSAWLEGAVRRLSLESSSAEVSTRPRTRDDRGGGALAISICICLFVFVCNRSFLYGDVEY